MFEWRRYSANSFYIEFLALIILLIILLIIFSDFMEIKSENLDISIFYYK